MDDFSSLAVMLGSQAGDGQLYGFSEGQGNEQEVPCWKAETTAFKI